MLPVILLHLNITVENTFTETNQYSAQICAIPNELRYSFITLVPLRQLISNQCADMCRTEWTEVPFHYLGPILPSPPLPFPSLTTPTHIEPVRIGSTQRKQCQRHYDEYVVVCHTSNVLSLEWGKNNPMCPSDKVSNMIGALEWSIWENDISLCPSYRNVFELMDSDT